MANHKEASRSRHRLHDIDGFARVAGQGLFYQHRLTRGCRRGADALVQYRRGHHHYCVHIRITNQIDIFPVITHIVLTGVGFSLGRVLATYGIQLCPADIAHEVASVTLAVDA